MNPIGSSILTVLVLVVLFAPPRWAVLGMMAGVLYLTGVQRVTVMGLYLFPMRFLELAGIVRVVARREFLFTSLNPMDWALVLLYSYNTIVFLLRSPVDHAYQTGLMVDACLCYFTFRGLMHDQEDLRWFLRGFLALLAPYTLLVLIESVTRHNLFSFLGGGMYDWARGDRFRCVGSFRHPSLLGTLGASFFPLYIGLACDRAERRLAVFGVGLCLLIVWASNSGGPLGATLVGVVGWAIWRWRTRMRLVRWGLVGGIALAAVVMKAPVWYLLDRFSALTGGDGWHRSHLMHMAFVHLGKWWFAGMPVIDTTDWFPYSLETGADITNQFVSFGLSAGLGAMALFILLFKRAFRSLGQALAEVRVSSQEPWESECLLWGLGVMLAAHIMNFLGITYFDQTYAIWFMQLAAIASVSASCAGAGLAETPEAVASLEEDASLIPEQQSGREAAST